jgi:hypothetical protein
MGLERMWLVHPTAQHYLRTHFVVLALTEFNRQATDKDFRLLERLSREYSLAITSPNDFSLDRRARVRAVVEDVGERFPIPPAITTLLGRMAIEPFKRKRGHPGVKDELWLPVLAFYFCIAERLEIKVRRKRGSPSRQEQAAEAAARLAKQLDPNSRRPYWGPRTIINKASTKLGKAIRKSLSQSDFDELERYITTNRQLL